MNVNFTNNIGDTLELTNPYLLASIEGLGDVEADGQSQKAPYQDGSTYIDSLFNERVIAMELDIYADNEVDLSQKRRKLAILFNPKLGEGELRVTIGENEYFVTAVSDFVPKYVATTNPYKQKVQVQLTAYDPYWHNRNHNSKQLQSFAGNFTLPTEFPIELGFAGDHTVLENIGDTDTPVTITINGPTTNPKINNDTTGEFIKVNTSIGTNEQLFIDTTQGKKRIELIQADGTRVNNFGKFAQSEGASFFKLVPGINNISYTADAGNANAIVIVSWFDRFASI